MALLLLDIGLLLPGPGPGPGWGALGVLGARWNGAAVAEFELSQLRVHVLEWLLMDACAALVVAAWADVSSCSDLLPCATGATSKIDSSLCAYWLWGNAGPVSVQCAGPRASTVHASLKRWSTSCT